MFTYNGNDNETYFIFDPKGRKFSEVFAAEDVVAHMVEILNDSDIKDTMNLF